MRQAGFVFTTTASVQVSSILRQGDSKVSIHGTMIKKLEWFNPEKNTFKQDPALKKFNAGATISPSSLYDVFWERNHRGSLLHTSMLDP